MSLMLLASALVFFAFPRMSQSWRRMLGPRDWSRLSVAALLGGVVALEGALGLIGSPTLFKLIGVPGLAVECRRILGELAAGGSAVGWSSLLLAALLPGALVAAWRRASSTAALMRIEPWLGEHTGGEEVTLVVLPTNTAIAYSIGGPSPQVVISQGMLEALEPGQVNAVIHHELSHVRHRHTTLVIGIHALDHVLPMVRPSTVSLRTGLERWADEDAAASGSHARVAVHDALLRVATSLSREPAVAAFTSVATFVDRLEALESPPPSPSRALRLSVHAAVSGVGIMSAAALSGWIFDARMMLTMVGFCR